MVCHRDTFLKDWLKTEIYSETDEQLFWMREPARIKLKEGWNTIMMEANLLYKTPFWFVSFTPVEYNADGRLVEVKGLRYR